jgi:hypothetical protein
VVKNYGQTPAFLKYWCVVFTCEDLPDLPVYYGYPGSGIVLDKEVVPANEPYVLPRLHTWEQQEFSPEDVRAIIDRKKIFNVYGCVYYGDIFGNPTRRLKFCETAMNFFEGPVGEFVGLASWPQLRTGELTERRLARPDPAQRQNTKPETKLGHYQTTFPFANSPRNLYNSTSPAYSRQPEGSVDSSYWAVLIPRKQRNSSS